MTNDHPAVGGNIRHHLARPVGPENVEPAYAAVQPDAEVDAWVML